LTIDLSYQQAQAPAEFPADYAIDAAQGGTPLRRRRHADATTPAYTCPVKRLHRRITAWLALFAICFVQIATAAHACALVDGVFGAPAVQAEATSPCADMGM